MVQKAKSDLSALLFAVIVPVSFLLVLVLPVSRALFSSVTSAHPYMIGFVKFAFLATTGEILAGKIATGVFQFPKGAVLKAGVWGLIGMMIVLLFPVFASGIAAVQAGGLLLGGGNALLTAVLISTATNCTFGISMMGFHRITDAMIEMHCTQKQVSVMGAVKSVDWSDFIGFVVCKTIPLFWIPAHSVTFMLPPQYRVFMSAFLSIILGLLLAVAKRKTAQKTEVS